MKKTILIFQNPDLYFFPLYKDMIYSPFSVREKSPAYLLYKILHLLHLPSASHFWGDWKEQISQAERVIIFDYGYQRGMEHYIQKINPDCQVSLFMWNKIDRFHRNHELFVDKNSICSTDPEDCRTYHLKHRSIFFPDIEELSEKWGLNLTENKTDLPDTAQNFSTSARKLLFVGADKGRGDYILQLKELFQKIGIDSDIRIHVKQLPKDAPDSFTDQYLPYPDYCRLAQSYDLLLDIVQEGQAAPTLRVMEALFFSKKLISNNNHLKDYDFYDLRNIFVLPKKAENLDLKALTEFLETPFSPYSKEVLKHYRFREWLENF